MWTTVTKGTMGLGIAIGYFAEQGYVVCVPLTDNQPYDLIIDRGLGIERVQVKYTSERMRTKESAYTCQLKTTRSNRTLNKIKYFDNTECDLLFIAVENKDRYLIPSKEIQVKTALTLNESMLKFKI